MIAQIRAQLIVQVNNHAAVNRLQARKAAKSKEEKAALEVVKAEQQIEKFWLLTAEVHLKLAASLKELENIAGEFEEALTAHRGDPSLARFVITKKSIHATWCTEPASTTGTSSRALSCRTSD
jgi:hypothetical protein